MRIRVATDEDISALLKCLGGAFAPYRPDYTEPASLDTVMTEASARERLAARRVLIAEDRSGVLLGTISWGRRSTGGAPLRGMAVRPESAGSGVALALLERACDELVRAGFRVVTLDTTAPLHRAIRFYERHGFRPSGRVSDLYGMPLSERVLELASPQV